ncbi:Protein MEX-3 protein b [Aphelenchoides avenae]|nr:Protein MEX-3 protein b [Aphelenchus avenae]
MADDAAPQFAPQFQLPSPYSFHPMAHHEFGITAADLPEQQPLQRHPGAWFYETGSNPDDGIGSGSASTGISGDVSPIAELTGDFNGLSHQQVTGIPGRHVTVSVEVPSSEHVAEIVGRQGCKIKSLRMKTNTYIKTPVRGEPPVFVVTGRMEDVMEAKLEIELAAEHFTQIRTSRRHSQGGISAPGHVTAYVRVPLRVVGLVVGPKGATIKRIQQDTHTYIITPSREREPIFEVTGLPQNVEAARREIEQHIFQRTGNMPLTDPSAPISSYAELQRAIVAAAANGHHLDASHRPPYGALAAGTHMLRGMGHNGAFGHRGFDSDYGMMQRSASAATMTPPLSSHASMICGSDMYAAGHMNSAFGGFSARGADRGSDAQQSNGYHLWSYGNNYPASFSSVSDNTKGFFASNGCPGRVESKLSDYLSGNYTSSSEKLSTGSEGARSESPINDLIADFGRLDTDGVAYPLISSIWSDVDSVLTPRKPVATS